MPSVPDEPTGAGPAAGRPEGPDTPVALGAAVAAARVAAGRTVGDIAASTRIRGSLLDAIEAGDFAPCGGAVYARGHLRSIARSLDLDAAPWIASYDRFSGAVPAPTATPSAPSVAPVEGSAGPLLTGRALGEQRRGPRWGLAMAGVLALVIVVAALALALPRHSGGTSASPPPPTTTTATPPVSAPPSPSVASSSPAVLADAGVRVVVNVHDQASWVDVTDQSGTTQFEGTIAAGQSRSFHAAQTLRFVFGYAPAVDLVVDGKDIGAPHATSGDVAKASFDVATASGD